MRKKICKKENKNYGATAKHKKREARKTIKKAPTIKILSENNTSRNKISKI